MFVVNDTSLISISPVFCATFLQPFFFISILFPLLPLRFHFSLISLFFNSFVSHFYTITAVDTCSLRLPIFISIPSDIQSYPIYNLFSRLLALRNIYSGRLLPLNIYSGRHWVRNALGMMDCHIHYAIVTVRFCTDIFSRFFALTNTRAGHDGQYWDDSIRKRLLRRRNNELC